MELFCRHITQCWVHKIGFQGLFYILPCISVIILQKTNRRIRSIINDIPKIFWLMKLFACFVLQIYSSDLTEYVHMHTPSLNLLITLAAPKYSISILITGVTFLILLTQEVFSISFIFVSFTPLGDHCL